MWRCVKEEEYYGERKRDNGLDEQFLVSNEVLEIEKNILSFWDPKTCLTAPLTEVPAMLFRKCRSAIYQ